MNDRVADIVHRTIYDRLFYIQTLVTDILPTLRINPSVASIVKFHEDRGFQAPGGSEGKAFIALALTISPPCFEKIGELCEEWDAVAAPEPTADSASQKAKPRGAANPRGVSVGALSRPQVKSATPWAQRAYVMRLAIHHGQTGLYMTKNDSEALLKDLEVIVRVAAQPVLDLQPNYRLWPKAVLK